ncbi:rhomboid family intramembrane serine protease [Pleionea sp. CnH1-48]|uniref:rhomboid family intramembrane serine protease n=1 Tax=Pleionea sp. CnH1-48 TaxID=2954494 RepID=UPI002096E913|nr:rhomboid family intramembrane serine protease [Pleionea sp. CnH1-48]MCO7225554.1 rhomboid family intramembrane serine protease [Pleionea sp. CnH1-48]
MLLIPSQVKLDRKNPPLLTLLLVIINLVVFFTLQLNDDEQYQKTLDYYQNSELFVQETDAFRAYLQTPDALADYRNISTIDTHGPNRIHYMAFDLNFRRYVAAQLALNQEALNIWQAQNSELNRFKNSVSFYRWGIKSEALTIDTLISHSFLHGDIFHLIGNLLFLVLFGVAVEALYGRLHFATLYVISAITSGLFFSLIQGTPYAPLIGASGAISGLMGAFVAYYGLQKVRFFGWFVFYFNHFKLPAYLVLGFWLLKEALYQLTDRESNIAYMAHLSGMITGALLGLLMKTSVNPTEEPEATPKPQQEDLYHQALELIRKLEFAEARQHLLTLLKQQPSHFKALASLYNIDKMAPSSPQYRETINQVFSFPLKFAQADEFVLSVSQEALDTHIKLQHIKVLPLFFLCQRLLRNDKLHTAEPLVEKAKTQFAESEHLPELLYRWGAALQRQGKSIKARAELNYLANYYAETEYGRAAIQHLKKFPPKPS